MSRKQVVYSINGVVSTALARMAGSKTFWVMAVFILTAADRWNRGDIAGADFFQMVQIGVIGILIRAALSQAEMAANAANPVLIDVKADTREQRFPVQATGGAACLIGTGALLALTACAGPTAASALMG